MRGKGTLVLLVGALIASLVSLFGGDGLSHLASLKASLTAQRDKNEDLRQYVSSMRREVRGLQFDDRTIEKAARNELGMARPGELVIFFDEKEKR